MHTKMDMKALLMKLEVTYSSASKYVDLTKYDAYTIARKLIDLIEENNGKKPTIKNKLTLVKGK